MNWLQKIKELLCRFWYDIFSDGDFIPGVEFWLSLYSRITGFRLFNWRKGQIAADTTSLPDTVQFPVYIDSVEVQREWYSLDHLWESGSAEELLTGSYTTDAQKDAMGWTAPVWLPIKEPMLLQTHLYGDTLTFVEGLDYSFENGWFTFYVDISKLDLPRVTVTDSTGYPHVLYRLFGTAKPVAKICDAVTGFESQWLNPYCNIAWDIHQNGVTFLNAKQLLGKASNSVICENEGIVSSDWTEQGYTCVRVGDRVYRSLTQNEPANIAGGTAVTAGDVLFGSLKMYKGADTPLASEIPGIKVMTDAGELTAYNSNLTIVTDQESGTEILPLAGNSDVVEAYHAVCVRNGANANCPSISIPTDENDKVNPYLFVSQKLRRGRSVVVRMETDDVETTNAAINCIRKSCCASGMVNIFLGATSDDQSAIVNTDSFLAEAGMMAVAVVGTLKIQEAYAEAQLI